MCWCECACVHACVYAWPTVFIHIMWAYWIVKNGAITYAVPSLQPSHSAQMLCACMIVCVRKRENTDHNRNGHWGKNVIQLNVQRDALPISLPILRRRQTDTGTDIETDSPSQRARAHSFSLLHKFSARDSLTQTKWRTSKHSNESCHTTEWVVLNIWMLNIWMSDATYYLSDLTSSSRGIPKQHSQWYPMQIECCAQTVCISVCERERG